MADKIILFFVLYGIYKLIDYEIRKKRSEADKKAHEKATEDRYKADIETPVEGKNELRPANACPSCGASLNGTSDKCVYCGAVIPENVLYNKEKFLEQQRIAHSQHIRELQHQEYEKEKSHKRAMELKKEERKNEYLPFFILMGIAALLFFISIFR